MILLGLIIAVLFPLLKALFPAVAIFGTIKSAIEPSLLFCVLLVISLLMISFNLFGNGLRDAFNPSLRGVEE